MAISKRNIAAVLLPAVLVVSAVVFLMSSCSRTPAVLEPEILLGDGWRLQSSEQCKETGKTIATPAFNPEGWYTTKVPTTVLAALVDNGVYKDVYFGKNLENIPSDQFKKSWWYRKTFTLDGQTAFSFARLKFEGINYSSNVWLNGQKIASADETRGAFRMFTLDVTPHLKSGRNVLAVEVFPPQPGDFTIGFVDWNPTPPDRNMGLWREVKILLSGPVSLNDPFVQTKVEMGTPVRAHVSVTAQLVNHGKKEVTGFVDAAFEWAVISRPFTLKPLEKKMITISPAKYKELVLENPRLWWPNNLGEPNLYELKISVRMGEKLTDLDVSDRKDVTFGIREVSDYINKDGHRGYRVNGKEVLIRGGGWVDDLMLADDDAKVEAQIKYAKHMNLNTIRLEGFWGSSQKLYDLADQYGLLLMPGWSCQWEWKEYLGKEVDEFGGVKTPEDMELVAKSLRDQVIWLRNHPSIFVWVLGSDMPPRPALENKYNAYMSKADPTRPLLSSCKYKVSEVSGPSAVKMEGPYDYVPPVYWYVDKTHGGAFGFNTETGPGPQPPPLESMRRMIPEENLWPIDDMWDYHCGRNEFNTMKRYVEALDHRYGKSAGVEDFLRKAQAANYEAMRAMFEAFGVHKPVATGVIQWMLNSAWPETYWQLYDHYLMPNGAFYGAKTACRPLTLVYNYGDKGIYVVNDTYTAHGDLSAEVRVLDDQSELVSFKTVPVAVGEYESKKILDFPEVKKLTPVYFVDLKLKDAAGKLVGGNFYWLSSKAEILDEAAVQWHYTPIKAFADLTGLETLPGASVDVTHRFETVGKEQTAHVTLKNTSDKIVFFIELKITGKESGQSILPVFWDDNYVSLLPGETKELRARFAAAGDTPVFTYSAWNIKK